MLRVTHVNGRRKLVSLEGKKQEFKDYFLSSTLEDRLLIINNFALLKPWEQIALIDLETKMSKPEKLAYNVVVKSQAQPLEETGKQPE